MRNIEPKRWKKHFAKIRFDNEKFFPFTRKGWGWVLLQKNKGKTNKQQICLIIEITADAPPKAMLPESAFYRFSDYPNQKRHPCSIYLFAEIRINAP